MTSEHSRRKWLIAAGVGAVVLAALAVSVLPRGDGFPPGEKILLGVVDQDGNNDIHVLSVGEEPSPDNLVLNDAGLMSISIVEDATHPYGSYSAKALYQDGRWLVQYFSNGDVVVASLDEDGVDEVYESRTGALSFYTRWYQPTSSVHLFEETHSTDFKAVCLTSDGVEPADPVARADYCGWTSSGVLAAYDESNDTSEKELDLEVTLNDGTSRSLRVDDFAEYLDVSADGRYALAARYSSGQRFAEAYDLETGESIAKTRGYDYLFVGYGNAFTGGPVLFATGINGEGDHSYLLFDPQEQSFVEIDGQEMGFSSDGATAFVETQDGDSLALAMVDLSSYETKDLEFSGEVLQTTIVPGYGAIVFDSSYHLSLVSTIGEVDLGRVEMSDSGSDFYPRFADDATMLLATRSDQDEASVYGIDLDSASMAQVVDNWAAIEVLGVAANTHVIFAGAEQRRDDVALYAVPLDGSKPPVELDDDAEAYWDLTTYGDDVYYTAQIDYGPGDIEVRRVDISGDDDPEILYEGARLLAASWNRPTRVLFSDSV